MKNFFYLSGIILLLHSCTTPLYLPNTANTPSLLEKGDLEVGGYLGTNAYGLQTAYAVTDEFGIMLNGSFDNQHDDSSDSYREHQFLELGGGYTHIINPDAEENETKYLFSGFGGFGFGQAEGLRNNTDGNNLSAGSYYRIFAQPSWGMTHENFEFFTTFKINYVQFNEIKNYLSGGWSLINTDGNDYNIFYEPTITFRVGGQTVKGVLQLGASIPQNPKDETAFKGREAIIILGIHANFGK